MSTNIDIQNFQDEFTLLAYEINATEAFLSSLWDKPEFFEKLCKELVKKKAD